MPQQQGLVDPDALRRALELSMAATAGDAEDDLQRALALSRAEAGIEAPPSAANPPVDLASALAAARAATAPEDELERALAASRADNDAALVAECRAVDAARVAAEADAEALAERRAAEERDREDLVISGVGAAADAARNAIVASTDALAAALFERPALKALFVDGGEAARRGVVKLLALGRSAAKWYPLHAPAVLRRVEIEFQAPHARWREGDGDSLVDFHAGPAGTGHRARSDGRGGRIRGDSTGDGALRDARRRHTRCSGVSWARRCV